jgi:Holliday junction resolvasome RuvABC DNA-binding subunit
LKEKFRGHVPHSLKELKTLPGIGDKMGHILVFLFREAGKQNAVTSHDGRLEVEPTEMAKPDFVVDEKALASLQNMGFSAGKAELCLRASDNNLECAIEYLVNGTSIPEKLRVLVDGTCPTT